MQQRLIFSHFTFTFSHIHILTFFSLFGQVANFPFLSFHFYIFFLSGSKLSLSLISRFLYLFCQVANESDAIVLKFGLTLQQIMDVVSPVIMNVMNIITTVIVVIIITSWDNITSLSQVGLPSDDESISFLCLKATINWIKLPAVDKIDVAALLSCGCNYLPSLGFIHSLIFSRAEFNFLQA